MEREAEAQDNRWRRNWKKSINRGSSEKRMSAPQHAGSEILNWGDMMAASALVVVPSVLFFMFIQNKIAGGMTDGAVK